MAWSISSMVMSFTLANCWARDFEMSLTDAPESLVHQGLVEHRRNPQVVQLLGEVAACFLDSLLDRVELAVVPEPHARTGRPGIWAAGRPT